MEDGAIQRIRLLWALGTRRPVDENLAWACFMTNLFVLPGLGTALLRKRSGIPQMVLGFLGFALTIGWLLAFATGNYRAGDSDWWLAVGLTGVALFAAAWVWALFTSLRMVRGTQRHR